MDKDQRKKAKLEYKELPPTPGVFQIKNNANGLIFVAGGINVHAAINKHKSALMFGSHENARLLADYKAFGPEAFTFEVLDFVEPDPDPAYNYYDDVKAIEALWLEKLAPYGERGYNTEHSQV